MSEVVFVQSKIRPGVELSPSVFRKWYEEVHIRDLLETPGVGTVFRYVNATAADEAQFPGFPYLAVYPEVSREWLLSETCEFLKVPLHSDLLPGPNGFVFDVADFVIGAYQEVGSIEDGAFGGEFCRPRCSACCDAWPYWMLTPTGPPKHVVVVPIDAAVAESQTPEEVLRPSLAIDSPVRSVLLRYDFSPAKTPPRSAEIAEGKLFVGRSYVAFVSMRLRHRYKH